VVPSCSNLKCCCVVAGWLWSVVSAVTAHHCHQHRAPWYLANYCVPVSEVSGRQHLWSDRRHQLFVPMCLSQHVWQLCFYCCRTEIVWVSLPDYWCNPAVDLKTHFGSSDVYTCVVLRTQSQIGDRSFSVVGPQLRNNLPTEIRRRGTTFEHYRWLLKVFLFV